MTRTVKKNATLTPLSDKKRVPVAINEKPKFRLHVDANRDGKIDDDPNGLDTWTLGKGKKGAVLLVNNNGTPALIDHDDDNVNGAADIADVTPLDIRRTGPTPPAGYKVVLSVSADDAKHIRIFDLRTAGGKEVVGPTKGEKYELPDLSKAKLELGMEAIRYAGTYSGKVFSGDVMVTLTTMDGAVEVEKHQATLRVAPWIMFNHFDTPEKVYVMTHPRNGPLVAGLTVAAGTAGASVVPIDGAKYGGDVWMQDIMEFGFSERPGRAPLRNVMETPRARELGRLKMPKNELVSADVGYVFPAEWPTNADRKTLNSGGNLECTPPFVDKAGKAYPLGRIYYSPTLDDTSETQAPGYVDFLTAQRVQKPFTVDAAWLNVGHVDEFVSFVPCSSARGFKVLLASPTLGLRLAKAAANSGAKMLRGRTYPYGGPNAEMLAGDLFTKGVAFDSDYVMSATELEVYNRKCAVRINGVRQALKKELNLEESDFAEVPIIYVAAGNGLGDFGRADALTGGMVNMVVLGKHCVAAQPFGPIVGSSDVFEQSLRATLAACGVTVSFVDTWDVYHLNLGEVHCGTNTLRKSVAKVKWWEIEP
jgi:Protein-arginine deiminase (PAD)/Protein-arginine deiminase (PAD) middle domain